MAGRKPLPNALKVLNGNPGKRVLGDDTAKVPATLDLKPLMPLHGPASREWNRIAPQLQKLGLLTDLDKASLTALCEAWGQYVTATERLHLEGQVVMGQRGGSVKNPVAQLARDAWADVLRLCTEFGMTPSSRGRIHVPGAADPEDDLSDIFS